MKKRLVTIILLSAMLLSAVSCGSEGTPNSTTAGNTDTTEPATEKSRNCLA